MEVPRFASVGLSLMLAVNCFMPCYTLAYADESQEVADVPEEEQEEIAGDAGGLEYPSGVGESDADAADGGAAAEGHGADDGPAEETGEDSSGLDGGLDASYICISSSGCDSGNFDSDFGRTEEAEGIGMASSARDIGSIEGDTGSSSGKA